MFLVHYFGYLSRYYSYVSYRFVDQDYFSNPENQSTSLEKLNPLQDMRFRHWKLRYSRYYLQLENQLTHQIIVISILLWCKYQNHQQLLQQLNKENLDQLFEKLDYSILKIPQLTGDRVEGTEDSFVLPFARPSAQNSTYLFAHMALICFNN